MKTETLLVVGLLAVGLWYFTSEKKKTEAAAPPAAASTGPPGYPPATSDAEAAAGIIETSGTALSDVLSIVWPD